jgi:hypothetical protein
VFPRTRKTTLSDTPFGTLSGFYGTLSKNGIISGEFNEQVGPATPGGVSDANRSNRPDPSSNVEKIGIDPNKDEVVSGSQEKTTPKKRIIEPEDWTLGMPLNKETFEKLEKAVEKLEIDPILFSGAIRQAVIQGIVDGDTALAKQKMNELKIQMYSIKDVVIQEFDGFDPREMLSPPNLEDFFQFPTDE